MLHNIVPEVIANQVRVPPVVVQQALHPVGSGLASLLRQLPAVLALHRAQQSPQVLQRPPARLRPPEPPRNALMHPLDALGPPGHLRHLVSPNNHHVTSSILNCPNSTFSQSETVALETISKHLPLASSPWMGED